MPGILGGSPLCSAAPPEASGASMAAPDCRPFPLSVADLQAAAASAHPTIPRQRPAAFAEALAAFGADFGVTTKLRIGHFVSQCAPESDWFRTTTEYASGRAYEGRRSLGNTRPGDGPRYKGRGDIQTTGRANYRMVTAELRERYPAGVLWRGEISAVPDLEAEPERLAEAPWATLGSLAWWHRNGANAEADRGDTVRVVERVSRGVNRGNFRARRRANGEAHRIEAFRGVMAALHRTGIA